MRLATLDDGTRDGALHVVDRTGTRMTSAASVARSLQSALDSWSRVAPELRKLEPIAANGEPIAWERLHSPLPRAYEWVDGSAYINHIILVRKARGAEPPRTLRTEPLVYQGGSGVSLRPREDVPLLNSEWGLDFESEVCVVLDDTPIATTTDSAGSRILLFMLCNDVTLRNLVPAELEKGFGFFNSKPATAFSPFAVTPDELGAAYRDGRVHLPIETRLNGELVGDPHAGPEMHFSFFDLIAHITKTRAFTAGTILGSGTVSNADEARGISCLAERRMREIIKEGKPTTPFLRTGDEIEIRMRDESGWDVFGTIRQKVRAG